ncbi:hypothetical protein TYRP_000686 [Tyrophagus putrescentiae]|nr:hypothetical protein TYRP_000686 [Tyrophagus putrescentiae]
MSRSGEEEAAPEAPCSGASDHPSSADSAGDGSCEWRHPVLQRPALASVEHPPLRRPQRIRLCV